MTLLALMKRGGLTGYMTATPATPATQNADKPATVATVAVAVLPEPIPQLSSDDESNIQDWLAHIEETDPSMIADVVDKCRNDLDVRRYFLKRSSEAPETVTLNQPNFCSGCSHFKRTDHPHLGHCAKGEPEAIAGLWDVDKRYCEQFLPRPQRNHDDQLRLARVETNSEFPK
jgi:hypothetical protein